MRRIVNLDTETTPEEDAVDRLAQVLGLRLAFIPSQPGWYQLVSIYDRPTRKRLNERRSVYSLTDIEQLLRSGQWQQAVI